MRAELATVVRARLAQGAALPALTCYDAATAVSVVEAADRAGLPVVLLVPPALAASEEGPRTIRALRSIADAADVPVCVQLDHANDLDLIALGVRAGVDAVLADGSRMPRGENAAFVRAARTASGPGVTFEAELGSIGGDEDRAGLLDPDAAGMTDPDHVAAFVESSGCDLLAVAVGNVHGRYRGTPVIDRDRLSRIHSVCDVPLVLHGASGLPSTDLAEAGSRGIGKVNVNTELRGVMLDALESCLPRVRSNGDDIADLTTVRAEAVRTFVRATLLELEGSQR